MFLVVKFEIFPQNYLIITEDVKSSYRVKLFLERCGLADKVLLYDDKHPSTLKSYKISLFNSL